jgi:hypothetical protein
MADRPITMSLVHEFIDRLKKNTNISSLEDIIAYCIKNQIIPTSKLRNYLIVQDYYEWGDSRVRFCITMEEKYDLSDSQINKVITHYQRKQSEVTFLK